jgi:hypothetical protein
MLVTLSALLSAALASPVRLPSEYSPLQANGSQEVSADFDGDGHVDTARVLVHGRFAKVAIWIHLGGERHFPLIIAPADGQWRATSLSVRTTGDHTCPKVTSGRRYCGRAFSARHFPSLVVSRGGREDHLWHWNRYAFQREEVYP